ncbi:phospho-N-acetylmuramoyl-pentapeptide-transferase [Flavobacteriaceae bacterium]|jgi:phospho-N-acetylmuramoyl-pentapeptide-transferase|nr:phospho-N-acetylmuramoyl-pentapeptide-transferase [Flavobacteriaceae bacterium]MDA8644568.1 phospho-N-acetylmuramoyl-pentapeptide-transferase [Flavobacteriaceae bacterium]MDA9037293.1 phospho-N-acetylmuramoyl-pentapeptide-transferase [Flavobacteriaceae bacterium]MDA9851115.1 phospho-N-acetylmuramoyl-pentapeptide-transferase [Flavobacteriaceae bacterium]MDC0386510.1 phospho-N-acetylmuramoyl-pentapeptide-transferase [Flavobacteriaceae bacterium]
MLYYLFEYLEQQYQLPGASLFQYISFRAAFAIILSMGFSMVFGKRIIRYLKRQQIGETVRDLGLEGQKEKEGTPTMGGLIIIFSTLIPVLLLARLSNIYIILLMITAVWMGFIGWLDDYIKIFKKNKEGLQGRFKIIGQVLLGAFVGSVLFFHPQVKVRTQVTPIKNTIETIANVSETKKDVKATLTTIPLLKNNEFNYHNLIGWLGISSRYTWLIFIPIVIFIITSVSNGANLTDGIDGLAAGTSAIIVFALAIFSWVSGNVNFAAYLNIMYLPNVGEIVVFISAFLGALIGFLWFNTYPAEIFMGDTGSLTLGALISVIAIIVRKELLIPLLCGVFFIETLSVILQVFYFKYTRSKTGVGQRIFKMAPLHHHFQKLGFHESKIVARFWILGIILAVLTIVTLKLR